MKVRKLHLFSHLPKTGGSTIKTALLSNESEDLEFYHMAINGIKTMAKYKGKTPFELFLKTEDFSNKQLILFGHKVNEGMLNRFIPEEIELSTIIRHPFSRLISQFYMRVNANDLDFSKTFLKNTKTNIDYICLFYVSRFPSLIDDPFDSLLDQAKSVLSHFDKVEYLENAPKALDSILDQYGLKYDSQYDMNRRTKPKNKKDVDSEDVNRNLYSWLRQDLELYNSVVDNSIKKTKELPSRFLKPNLWMFVLINITITHKGHIIKSIASDLLNYFIVPQLEYERIEYNILFNSLSDLADFQSHPPHVAVNLFDIFCKSLVKCKKLPDAMEKNADNYFERILSLLRAKQSMNIYELNDPVVLTFPHGHLTSFISKAKYFVTISDFEKAEEQLMFAIKTYPGSSIGFEELYSLSKTTGNKDLNLKCFNKLLELRSHRLNEFISVESSLV